MNNYQFKIPQDIIFGSGSTKKLPEILADCYSKNILVISDRSLEKLGVVAALREIVEQAGIKCSEFLEVMPNPTVECVNDAAVAYKTSGSTAIVALGGGSPMDVAKSVGILAKHGGIIDDYEGFEMVPGSTIPVIAVPTTAGTGSEVTPFSVIEDTKKNHKMSINSPEIIPRYAILDPELIITLPAPIAAATGMDALVHAIEAYLSRSASLFSDVMAEKALELIGGNLRRFVACRQDIEAAEAMMSGSMFAGLAFSIAHLGIVHAMSHPVSAYYNVPHGVANAILLPEALDFNELADNSRYNKIYSLINRDGCSAAQYRAGMLSAEVRELISELGIPAHLSYFGVKEELISEMAMDAIKSANIACNPRQTNVEEIEKLYKKCM